MYGIYADQARGGFRGQYRQICHAWSVWVYITMLKVNAGASSLGGLNQKPFPKRPSNDLISIRAVAALKAPYFCCCRRWRV